MLSEGRYLLTIEAAADGISDRRGVPFDVRRPRCTRLTSGRRRLRRMAPEPARPFPPDPVIEYYKKDVDRTLLREHLRLTPQQRLEKLVAFMRSLEALRAARRRT